MQEDNTSDSARFWRNGHDTIAHVDIAAEDVAVLDRDGHPVHFHETDDDPDGTPAYEEDELADEGA